MYKWAPKPLSGGGPNPPTEGAILHVILEDA